MPSLTRLFFSSLILSAALASGDGTARAATDLDDGAIRRIVERAATEIRDAYIDPEKGAAAARAIESAAAAGNYAAIAEPEQLAARLTSDLQAVARDTHLRVLRLLPPAAANAQSLVSRPTVKAGFERVDRLKENIGYLRLARFIPAANFEEAANSALRLIAGVKALILDMRGNGGGDPASVAYLCSFFFDPARPVHVNDIVWRERGAERYRTNEFWTRPTPVGFLDQPVYILAGPQTFSGGEEFVYDMKILGRAVVIGGTTKGGANPGGVLPLGNGLGVFVPAGRAENPKTKSNWEGVGVEPDFRVDPDDALAIAVDAAISRHPPIADARLRTPNHAADVELLHWLDESLLDKVQIRTAPFDGGEAAIRRLAEDFAAGRANEDLISERMIGPVIAQLPTFRATLAVLGSVQSVTLRQVGDLGDVYGVQHEHGRSEWTVIVKDGKVELAFLRSE